MLDINSYNHLVYSYEFAKISINFSPNLLTRVEFIPVTRLSCSMEFGRDLAILRNVAVEQERGFSA